MPPHPSAANTFHAALRRTLDSPSFTVLVRAGSDTSYPGQLVEAGIYQNLKPVHAELVLKGSDGFGPRRLAISFAIGNRLYVLSKVTPVLGAEGNSGLRAVIDPVRALVSSPLAARSWTRHGTDLIGTQPHGRVPTTWTVTLQSGLISSITETQQFGKRAAVTTTTIFGIGVSVVPSPDNKAAERAAALIDSA
jgi:hypothetical protein